jgi:hypothetical protein
MASTRNKNTPGNYELEEKQYFEKRIYNTYIHSGNGMPVTPYHPGDGLLPSKMAQLNCRIIRVTLNPFCLVLIRPI